MSSPAVSWVEQRGRKQISHINFVCYEAAAVFTNSTDAHYAEEVAPKVAL